MGGAGEELDLAPHSARRPQHQPFFVLVFTLAPSGFCGWCSALHLALLGRLQEEAEAVASSTLFFSPAVTAGKSWAHIGRKAKKRML